MEATLPTLTDAQWAATGRDHRPLHLNPLVFAFKTRQQYRDPQNLTVVAPAGYVFREDCMPDLEVYEAFGSGEPFPMGYRSLSHMLLVSCAGDGRRVGIHLDPEATQGVLAEESYVIRIRVGNPAVQPSPTENEWVVSYGLESAHPFQGIQLWTFNRVSSPHTVSHGATTSDSGVPKFPNPVTFTFSPVNTISGTGMVFQVRAPNGFQIAHNSLRCDILMQPVRNGAGSGAVPPDPEYFSPPSHMWGEADVDCRVDEATLRMLTATVLASDRTLTAGWDYQLTILVHNPSVTVPENMPGNEWTLETFNSPGTSPVLPLFRDKITILGYHIVPRVWDASFVNQNPRTGEVYKKGLQRVVQLYFDMQFPNKLETVQQAIPPDELSIVSPPGYRFEGDDAFTWEPAEDAYLYLPDSTRTYMNGNSASERSNMTFTVTEPLSFPAMRALRFRIDVRNPAKTPHLMLNHWTVTHLTWDGEVRSTQAIRSWPIEPQLANVRIDLIGLGVPKSAGSMSRMAVSFLPISDADELELEGYLCRDEQCQTTSEGFDFTGCGTTSEGHEIIATATANVRVRAAIYANVQADIHIDNFMLVYPGGRTTFDLKTKLSAGDQRDEALNFRPPLVVPGRLEVAHQTITNGYSDNPALYPGQRDVRMNEPATVRFRFTVTMDCEEGDYLSLASSLYTLSRDNFTMTRYASSQFMPVEVVTNHPSMLNAHLHATPLQAGEVYQVELQVTTPNAPNPRDAMWTVEIWRANGTGALPRNSNDGRMQGFPLGESVGLRLSRPNAAAPMAPTTVEFSFDPRTARPTTLVLYAPPLYTFPSDCLVQGGASHEILSCTRIEPENGRERAQLVARAGGLYQSTEMVVLSITTPSMNAMNALERRWFIDARTDDVGQVGWGEDPVGISVRQMIGAAVCFSGVPEVTGTMAFRFYTSEKLELGGRIRVYYPRSLTVMVNGDNFYPVAIEGEVERTNYPRQGMFELTMARPLPPGQQAFAVAHIPPNQIDDNNFRIVVYSNLGQVVDANMMVPGNNVQHGITVRGLEPIWTSSQPESPSLITVGFELLEEMPARDPPQVGELVVKVPDNHRHQVTRASHVEILTLPLKEGDWLRVSDPRRLILRVEATRMVSLPVGSYRFSFPVLLPARMPKYNVYEVSLIRPTADGSNLTWNGDQDDPRHLVTFAMPGFNLGDTHPMASMYMLTAGAPPPQQATGLVPLLAPLLALAWALLPRGPGARAGGRRPRRGG